MGSTHMKRSLDASVPAVQSQSLRQWLLLEDSVLSLQAAIAMGAEALQELAGEYVANGSFFEGAKVLFTSANVGGSGDYAAVLSTMKEAHALLERGNALATPEGQQLGE